ncbi:MAG: class I SAM-dependent methyltransferase [Mucilaginibacter sp.]
MNVNKKTHWENIYTTRNPDQVSWTQQVPATSLDFIQSFRLSKTSKIIDIGGGDSKLVDYLLEEGFEDITVLDISETALAKAKIRLGSKGEQVKWVVSDITDFKPTENYDVWHDRATFHFLTKESQMKAYMRIAGKSVKQYMVVGTFSENGPGICSGLPVRQYTEQQLENQLLKDFKKIKCINEDHITPFRTKQNFLFCSFKRQ